VNANTPFPAPRPAISAAERARREKAVSFARGSVRYEGFTMSEQADLLDRRFVEGDLSLENYIREGKALAGLPS
jgi:hypothetical protein